ncbi:MAG TPA: translation initiation factor IF-6 [Thermoplasmata archaeon]|nr:translation initiation factor IF-6 [Thermoplasmata archaeon]
MPVGRASFAGSPYLGVHLRTGERAAVAPPSVPRALVRDVERLFGVPVVRTTVCETEVVGTLVAFNSHGAVVGDEIDDGERAALERVAPVSVVRARQNALGNNVLANDLGAVVHPEFTEEQVGAIGRALKVPARRGTVAGLGTVGMAGIATNRGVVVHPKVTEPEVATLLEALQVPVHRSTANFGVPVVGACVVANSRAILIGRLTTPVELVHIQEGLQVFD